MERNESDVFNSKFVRAQGFKKCVSRAAGVKSSELCRIGQFPVSFVSMQFPHTKTKQETSR